MSACWMGWTPLDEISIITLPPQQQAEEAWLSDYAPIRSCRCIPATLLWNVCTSICYDIILGNIKGGDHLNSGQFSLDSCSVNIVRTL